MQSNSDISSRIDNGDTSLFATIESQSTLFDKRSLLALHSAMRRSRETFNYLEIGSHLGGSLQALAADQACTAIISIDPRPTAFGDQRGIVSKYPDNSTERMLSLLKSVPGSDTSKITTLDSDTNNLSPNSIQPNPNFCFIDGEHTDVAALRDARFCLKAMQYDGCIVFHDANVVYAAIKKFVAEIENSGIQYRAYLLPDALFVVEVGETRLSMDPIVMSVAQDAWRGYIVALEANEWYRAALNKPLFKALRRIRFIRRLFVVKDFPYGQPL